MKVWDNNKPANAPGSASPSGYRLAFVSVLASAIGCLTGLIAFALYNLIGLFTNISYYHVWSFHFRSPQHTPLGAWVIVIPVVGGLVIGLMAKYGSEKIRGHGIPEAMEAVLISRSRIEAKVAILKPLSAAIGIGTGGPFGAEGPIIQTGGAFGSLVGQLFSTTAAERKVMLACGGAAGLAATFNAPITGVLLGLELLLFEFRARSFIPLVIASAMAVGIRRVLLGTGPMFLVGAPGLQLSCPTCPTTSFWACFAGFAAVGFSRHTRKIGGLLRSSPLGAAFSASGDRRSRARDRRLPSSARSWLGIRHNRRHPQRAPCTWPCAADSDLQSLCCAPIAWLGNIGRHARADVHD